MEGGCVKGVKLGFRISSASNKAVRENPLMQQDLGHRPAWER